MKISIKHRRTNEIIYESEAKILKGVVQKAAKEGADLEGAYLEGADLWGAYLQGADLLGAYLQGADLQGADLEGADLRGANLEGADLQGAYLRGADLQGAYLRGADLQGAYLRGADLQGADLQGADLQGAKNYCDSHDFFFELVRRTKIEIITKEEWQIVGQLSVHRWCWDEIKQRLGESPLGLLGKIADAGFDEYLKRYKVEFTEDKKGQDDVAT